MTETTEYPKEKIKIGISSCLLGQKVRFDGQHKYHWYINEVLSDYFEYVSICPELEIGMGVPRKTVRLVGELDHPEMIEPTTGKNWTDKMNSYSEKKVAKLGDICGYLFKKGSPSCGAFRTKVYQDSGIPLPNGQGLFAAEVCRRWPLLPVEDEGRLNDAKLRENFIARVFGYDRLKKLCKKRFKKGDWVHFHSQNKYLLLAHSRKHYTELGELVAHISEYSATDFKEKYSEIYMNTLAIKTTTKKNYDVLQHILGFLKKHLTKDQKANIIDVLNQYYRGIIPLIVPITLLRHYIEVFDIPYIKDQYYLSPHPMELSLRNAL